MRFNFSEMHNEITKEYFLFLLDWSLRCLKRYQQPAFSLIVIDFKNPDILGRTYSSGRATKMLADFFYETLDNIRTTDFLYKMDLSTFWLYLPFTEIAIVREKVHKIVNSARDGGLDVVDGTVCSYNFPDPRLEHVLEISDPERLLAALLAMSYDKNSAIAADVKTFAADITNSVDSTNSANNISA